VYLGVARGYLYGYYDELNPQKKPASGLCGFSNTNRTHHWKGKEAL